MNEFTKGELKIEQTTCNALDLLFQEDGSQLAQIMDEDGSDLTDNQIANAQELVRRWNNFPKLKQQRDDLLAALVRYGEHEPGCIKGDACNCGLRAVKAKAKD